ncbi:MAG TPA: hypothetical protein VE008_07115 [Burkholderiales bacterium]|nr:hypothetical protein [Burkholderiales bacterium]
MGLHSDTELYRAVIDFQKFVASTVIHLRRDVKQMYGERLVDESLWMPVIVRHANVARDEAKLPHFEQLLDHLEISQVILRVLRDGGWLTNTHFAASIPITASIGKQTIALRNTFAPAPSPAA